MEVPELISVDEFNNMNQIVNQFYDFIFQNTNNTSLKTQKQSKSSTQSLIRAIKQISSFINKSFSISEYARTLPDSNYESIVSDRSSKLKFSEYVVD